jgi:signal transduction histidine kinase
MDPVINILVVDDVAQNLIAVEAVLKQPGVQIVRASSGNEALERLLVEDFALALVDVRMPHMDGFELAELMRGAERTRTIPIIFMTAAANDPIRTFRGYEAGAVDFLHKPFDPDILKSKVDVFIELYLQRHRLSAQLDEIRNALRLNEVFAAVLGHDLRNPLNAISGYAHVIRRSSKEPNTVAMAERIQASVSRMATMIEQLLDVARIRAGGVSLETQTADVLQVCTAIRDELEATRGNARIALTSSGDTVATFDVGRMSQVVSNLVGNALQHGSTEAPVEVSVNGADVAAVSIRISNRGTIPAERMKSLFEPFRPGETTQNGLGLGLYIASQFIQAHGGQVSVASGEMDQTVFELFLPRIPPAANAAMKLEL